MTEVYWLEQTEADIPSHEGWLSATEMVRLRALRFPKRRADWRVGRWTAKLAASTYLGLPSDTATLASIEVHPQPSGAPQLFLDNRLLPVSLSLSHCRETALCILGPPDARLGCDLEFIEARSDSFAADFFTADEHAVVCSTVAAERPKIVTLIWSAKESALKVLQEGLRLDTRSVELVSLRTMQSCTIDRWHPLLVRPAGQPMFHGWWQFAGDFIRTVLALPAPLSPVALRSEPGSARLIA